jgi:hypothetical protein
MPGIVKAKEQVLTARNRNEIEMGRSVLERGRREMGHRSGSTLFPGSWKVMGFEWLGNAKTTNIRFPEVFASRPGVSTHRSFQIGQARSPAGRAVVQSIIPYHGVSF